MPLVDMINADMKAAMKSKEKQKLTAIRAVKSAILLAQTESANRELSEADEIKLLQKLVKQRKESLDIYTKQSREDLAAVERIELEVISAYLPAPPSDEEVEATIKGIIAETGAESMKDMGKVMGMATKKLSGVDGKLISGLVRKLLG